MNDKNAEFVGRRREILLIFTNPTHPNSKKRTPQYKRPKSH
jgi:hypothetical protein